MKYVFFGSPRFAKIVLSRLLDANTPPIALVANPDRPVGRKHIITPPETKKLLAERAQDQIKISQPEKLSTLSAELGALSPDLFVVAAYAKIIPQAILDIPRLGTVGVHPSLLPKYRGASPIQSALLAGEAVTGVTLYKLGAGVDDGPVLMERDLAIKENDDYDSLEEGLARLGGDMLVELMPRFSETRAVPQNDEEATFTRKFMTEDGFIEASDLEAARKGDAVLARTIHNKIRALGREPGAWTIQNGKRLKLLRSEAKDGKLVLREIQWEGKTPERL